MFLLFKTYNNLIIQPPHCFHQMSRPCSLWYRHAFNTLLCLILLSVLPVYRDNQAFPRAARERQDEGAWDNSGGRGQLWRGYLRGADASLLSTVTRRGASSSITTSGHGGSWWGASISWPSDSHHWQPHS